MGAAAIVWRLTWGTDEALDARAAARAAQGGAARSLQAEREASEGTGPLSYDVVIHLMTACQGRVRDQVGAFPYIEVDGDVPFADAVIHTHSDHGVEYVAMTPRNALAATSAAHEQELMPPLNGRYVVAGYVAYSRAPIHASAYENRTYNCVADVADGVVTVKSVSLRLVQ